MESKNKQRYLWVLVYLTLLVVQVHSASEGDVMLGRANEYFNRGEYKRAILLYRKAAQRGAPAATVSFNIGNAYFLAGDLPASVAAYRRAIRESNGNMDAAWFNLAGVHFRLNNFGESIAAYRQGLDLEPSNVNAWLYIAEAFEKTGDLISAHEALEKARTLRPQDNSIVYQLAEIHIALREIPIAVRLVRDAYELDPVETDFLFYAADLLRMNEDTAGAIDAYREALAVDPENVPGLYRLASVLADVGERFAAIDYLNQVLTLKPDYTDAILFLGNLYFDIQWWDRALTLYKTALKFGERESIYGLLNIAYENLGRGDRQLASQALEALSQTRITDPAQQNEYQELLKRVSEPLTEWVK